MSPTRADELHHDRYHNMKAAMCAAGATAVLLALAAPARAEIATLTYEAVLTDGFPDIGWPDDVAISGRLIYDTDAAPQGGTANDAYYPGISHEITLTKDAVSATFVSPNGVGISVENDRFISGVGYYRDSIHVSSPFTSGSFYGFDIRTFFVHFSYESTNPSNILVSTALPTSQEPFNALTFPRFVGLLAISGESDHTEIGPYGFLTSLSFSLEPDYALACEGFYEPFDRAVNLNGQSGRVIPLRMSLLDQDGLEVGPDLVTPPVVSVSRTAAIGGGELDELVQKSAGRATEGNSFVWDETDSLWMFNISTKPFRATGTYTVSVDAGDDSYLVGPTCVGTFVRQ